MTALIWMLLGATALWGLYGLHRCALWMEGRGWIYYLRAFDHRVGVGTAFLEMQAIPKPDKQQVIESKKSEDGQAMIQTTPEARTPTKRER